jgi:glycine/D-amino acid oxidase-like deaminating enzyme
MTAQAPDVAVIGAGIVGTATAYELARRGAQVTLLDRGPVSGGTTGLGEGNVLCSDKDAGPELDLTVAGMAVYDDLERLLGPRAGIRRKGALIVHPDAQTWAAEPARAQRLRTAGVEARLLDAGEVHHLEPELAGPIHGALHVPGDLQCDPREIARGLAEEAQRLGAHVRTHTPVTRIAIDDGRATGVELEDGEHVAAGAVVLASGPWSRPLAEAAGIPLPLEPRKGQLARLKLPQPDEQFLKHKIVDGGYLLSVASTGAERQLTTVIETTADGHLVVGSSRERCGFDDKIDRELAAAMRARAARLVPAAATLEIDDIWVGFRPWLPDHLPAIGPSSAVAGLWIATGHEGAGVALGPITGRVLAQALTGEATAVPLDAYAPDRFACTNSPIAVHRM